MTYFGNNGCDEQYFRDMIDGVLDAMGIGSRYYDLAGLQMDPVPVGRVTRMQDSQDLASMSACFDPYGMGHQYFELTLGIHSQTKI